MKLRRTQLSTLMLVCSVAALLILVVLALPSIPANDEGRNVAGVPQAPYLPDPEPTQPAPPPGLTPTWPAPTNTPGPVVLQPAALIIHTTSTASMLQGALQPAQTTVDSAEAIHSMTWSPTGDKFLYVTNAGKLYWSNTDGTDATLLHQYEPDTIWRMLEDQQPMSNTLLLTHVGPALGMVRGPGHIDVVHFSPGQAPIIEEVHDAGAVFQIRWWSSDRASGIVSGAYVGGDKLVTLDANGRLVEERNIPYMVAGAVSPGGQWLAYATGQQSWVTPMYGSDPETIYLLNLITGERKQITASGQGNGAPMDVHSWSPDGNWFLIGASVDGALRGVLVSADGQEWVIITSPGSSAIDAVWSPDSKRLAYSIQSSGAGEDAQSPSWTASSDIYIVDIPSRKVSTSDDKGLRANSGGLMMQPKWSPDGSQLAFLSFDPSCDLLCSGLVPALYLLLGQ